MSSQSEKELKRQYLDLIAEKFDSEEKVATEIIHLESILDLPKGTEHFVSDLHGEYHAFQHVLRNGSGNVQAKIHDIFQSRLSHKEMNTLIALVYYPEEKIKRIKNDFNTIEESHVWYKNTINHLLELIKYTSSKYTRTKLRHSLAPEYRFMTEELLYKSNEYNNKKAYYETMIQQIIQLHQADKFMISLAHAIQRLVVDHLHVVGDIYDRGPAPDKIMDTLIDYHSVDIQWGNHDVLWMGAYAGSKVCLANLLRICARYDNLDIIEDAYGINLRPLLTLAEKYYDDNPAFRPKKHPEKNPSESEILQITKIHQAIAMIQFKLEGPIIKRRPEFEMTERLLLDRVNYRERSIEINGKVHPITNTCFKTVDPRQPTALLEEEKEVMDKLLISVQESEKLRRHVDFLMKKGNLYLRYNGNLLIHGCIPIDAQGEMEGMTINGRFLAGRQLIDEFEKHVREAYEHPEVQEDLSTDLIWYLWTGKYSSLFGKRAMTTFERYFIEDKSTHKEEKNPYYRLRENEDVVKKMLQEFDLNPEQGRIINGHTPVKERDGENPIKANGKMLVIDGGFSKAYQSTTGIAGYTLLYNSFGMQLVAHQHFNSKENMLETGEDELSIRRVVDEELERKLIRDTNEGIALQKEIDMLKALLSYRYMK
ncbi:fructose-1,6-bisphosphatase [Staphylococcus lutrae]|uniref:Fructose-1,6-bisphosphatase class 3 n=1 Tax=Staphylococcus lutrae TaxID=155085 RepID=A0AAC9RRY5_9STAP|nr:fructose-1,6-bisphosphatase [Staphylococcus lutrae]ARJ50584.1 fructose-bisphosphatase class III [Staphylococcus lutrae]PNZ37512.1 fructose-bisphosphatase class III [Staphylococcus lutrae]